MITHHKKESFAPNHVPTGSNPKRLKHILPVKNVVRNFILFREASSKKTVVGSVGIDMEGREGLTQSLKRETHKGWWLIISSVENWLDQILVRIVEMTTKGLKRLTTIIANHLESGGYVVLVIGDGTRPSRSELHIQSEFSKRYAKFIGKGDSWQTIR